MESHLPIFVITLILFVGVSASTVTLEMYWKNALPNTQMPTVIKTSLQSVGKHEMNNDRLAISKGCIVLHRPPSASGKDADDYQNKFEETFMLENKLIPGRIIEVRLRSHVDNKVTFLPLKLSDSIPFSSHKLTEILENFVIQPTSPASATIKETLKNCEQQDEGQEKLCATSLEAMVTFVKSKLGDHVIPISTTYVNRAEKIKYKITWVKKLVDCESSDFVVCHKEMYPYAVFSCHKGEMTGAFAVSMAEEETGGAHVEVVVVCHKDTTWWAPTHLSFQLLHVKPGKTTPVCHFLDDLAVLWTNKRLIQSWLPL